MRYFKKMFNNFIENIKSMFRECVIFNNVFNMKNKIVISFKRKYNNIFIELFILIKNLKNLNLN